MSTAMYKVHSIPPYTYLYIRTRPASYSCLLHSTRRARIFFRDWQQSVSPCLLASLFPGLITLFCSCMFPVLPLWLAWFWAVPALLQRVLEANVYFPKAQPSFPLPGVILYVSIVCRHLGGVKTLVEEVPESSWTVSQACLARYCLFNTLVDDCGIRTG